MTQNQPLFSTLSLFLVHTYFCFWTCSNFASEWIKRHIAKKLYELEMPQVNEIVTIYIYNIYRNLWRLIHFTFLVVKILVFSLASGLVDSLHRKPSYRSKSCVCCIRCLLYDCPFYDCPLYRDLLVGNSADNHSFPA